MVREIIINKLREVEQEYGVKIIFAVESGSRAWGLESTDSDYDVRFVFKRLPKDYITIKTKADVINAHYDKEGNKQEAKGCFIDMCGFDIIKFSKMLSSSNPTVIEWLNSKILYLGARPMTWIKFASEKFNPRGLYWHYKSMCKQNYLKYLKSGNDATYKRYMYAMRGLLNAKFVSSFSILPPINFVECVNICNDIELIPSHIYEVLSEAIRYKKDKEEGYVIKNYVNIDKYIESELKDDSDVPETRKNLDISELDNFMRTLVLE